MWVTVIAYDSITDQFLGVLGNRPRALFDVVQFDNVAFRWDESLKWPLAIANDGTYPAAAWPRDALADSTRNRLVRAIRSYRAGMIGHDVSAFDRCVSDLELLTPWPGTTREETFLQTFLLGRCFSERGETLRAISQFRRAVRVSPDSIDAHVALLAEYSVMAHRPQLEPTEGTEKDWENVFLNELAFVRERFQSNAELMRILDWLFERAAGGDLTGLTSEQLAKRKRVGFAILRWRQR
ncbi:MAG TPA: hypothetical protein VM656_11205 [Pyrinomonadaceae bacterium]|nr:hypothetical protein [Pyrinomonadaceae bacterium]